MNANSRLTTARFFRRMHHEGQAQAQAQAAGSVRLANKNSQFKARDGNTSHEEHPEKRQEKAFKPVDGLLREALARLRAPGVRR
ncbi:MAG: hypothetical protein ABI895_28555 [Deltaproteobacteria bacterium]